MLSNAHLVLLFLSDFGFQVGGQGILYCHVSATLVVFLNILRERRVGQVLLAIPVLALLSCAWSLYFNFGKSFGAHSSGIGLFASSLSVCLFAVTLEATRFCITKFTPKLLFFLIFVHGAYFLLELVSFVGIFDLRNFLNIFHINPKALTKMSMSLFGREHSYGSMGPLILLMIASIFYSAKKISLPAFSLILASCMCFIIVLTSKTALFTAFTFLLLYFFRFSYMNNFSGWVILGGAFLGLYAIYLRVFTAGYVSDILMLQGASSFLRFYFAVAGIYMIFTYPVFGVGIGGYKFNFSEAVSEWSIPVKFDIQRILSSGYHGAVDPTNFFIGILSEFGLVLGLPLLFLMFREYFKVVFNRQVLSCLATVVVSFFGFYYWSQPFVVLMLTLPLLIKTRNGRI